MSKEVRIAVKDGKLTFIHNDDVFDALKNLGPATTTRASHVEPATGGWTADMGPVGGPVLGPFARRDIALSEEVKHLEGILF